MTEPVPYLAAHGTGTPASVGTVSPRAAQAHARAQAQVRVPAMPTVPAAATVDRPAGVAAADMVWEETLAAGGSAGRELARGTRLRLIDLAGDACVSMLVFNAERPSERLNIADTVKVQWNAYLGVGSLLLSDMGRVLLSVLVDTAATHDTFCGPSNAATNARRYGCGANSGPYPNARDRLLLGAAKFGLARRDVHPCVNWFKGVRIGADGALTLQVGPFSPGRSLTLRADMKLIVILTNCPHPCDTRPDYRVTPVRVSAWRGPAAAAADPIRQASPEAQRAFLNVDEYFQR